ncbi:MAG: stage II sporulation protein M [archaeon]|nr:stage II sporulation protein M [archaeon]
MVLESLIQSKTLLRHPITTMILAIILSSASMWLAYATFPNSASILSLAFITIGFMPVMFRVLQREEKEESHVHASSLTFIERHFHLIKVFAFFFIGLMLSYSFWYVVLPNDVKSSIFKEQESTLKGIEQLRAQLTGYAILNGKSCSNDFFCWMEIVFINNSIVLFLAIILSFAFAAGSIFLLGWNASIIGVVIGKDILAVLPSYSGFGLLAPFLAYLHGFYNAVGLVPHGVPEILGYLVGAIAGGIISVTITKRHLHKGEFEIMAKDAAVLIIIALLLLLIGAVIEAGFLAAG